jgi:hypothetical protein
MIKGRPLVMGEGAYQRETTIIEACPCVVNDME